MSAPRRTHGLAAACVGLFLLLTAAGLAVVALDEGQRRAKDERLLAAKAGAVRAELEEELYRTINLARGLRSYAVANPTLQDPDRLETLLADLYRQGKHIRNIGVAPDEVLSVVHPVEGNEAAIGLRYADVPEQYGPVRLARRTRATVLAGPVDLVQGGRGLINRTPVFLEDGSYWGVMSLVLDVDSLMGEVERETRDLGVAWSIHVVDADGRLGEVVGSTETGPDEVDAADDAVRSANLTMQVPNAAWEVQVASASVPGSSLRGALSRAVVLVAAAVLAWLVFQVVRARWRTVELSLQDPLTGLPNRRLLEERLERELVRHERTGEPCTLVFLDLDRFKPVNDVHGHRAGDHVLRTVAHRLRRRLRAADTVARVGGDEFVALLPATGREGGRAVVEDLRTVFAAPIGWRGAALQVGVSAGLATCPDDGTDPSRLLQRADAHMYEEKLAGRESARGPGPTREEADAGEPGREQSDQRRQDTVEVGR